MIEKRERFRTWTIFLPGRSTFIFLWLFLVEPTVKQTHSLKSMFPHGIVSVPPTHSGSSVVKCPYSFLTAAIMNSIINLFLSRNKFHINSPFWSLIENKQTNKKKSIFLIPGCLCAVLWHQDGFQRTQLSVYSFGTWGISNWHPVLKHFNDLISKARATLFVQHQFVHKADLWERHSQTRHRGH